MIGRAVRQAVPWVSLSLLLGAGTAFGETEISGTLPQQIWTKADGPYYVVGPATIEGDLEIEAGTEVFVTELPEEILIEVQGALFIDATGSDPVVIQAEVRNGNRVLESLTATTADVSGLVLRDSRYGLGVLDEGRVVDSRFEDSGYGLWFEFGGNGEFDALTFVDIGTAGIFAETASGTVNVSNSVFIRTAEAVHGNRLMDTHVVNCSIDGSHQALRNVATVRNSIITRSTLSALQRVAEAHDVILWDSGDETPSVSSNVRELDPLYADESTLRLSLDSPAIDAASSMASDHDRDFVARPIDGDGNPNPEGDHDLGAYEFDPESPTGPVGEAGQGGASGGTGGDAGADGRGGAAGSGGAAGEGDDGTAGDGVVTGGAGGSTAGGTSTGGGGTAGGDAEGGDAREGGSTSDTGDTEGSDSSTGGSTNPGADPPTDPDDEASSTGGVSSGTQEGTEEGTNAADDDEPGGLSVQSSVTDGEGGCGCRLAGGGFSASSKWLLLLLGFAALWPRARD